MTSKSFLDTQDMTVGKLPTKKGTFSSFFCPIPYWIWFGRPPQNATSDSDNIRSTGEVAVRALI